MSDSSMYIPLSHRAVIAVSGKDRTSFLQGLITNNIEKATKEHAIYAFMLTPQGKFLYDFFIITRDDDFLLDIPRVHKDIMLKKLAMYKLRSDVTLTDLSDTFESCALLGEGVVKEIGTNAHEGQVLTFCKGIAYLDPRSPKLYARAIIEKDNHYQSFEAKNFSRGTFEQYENIRINAVIASADHDMISGESFPMDFGYGNLNTIDFNKGCYVGQEVTARVFYKSEPKKAVYLVTSDTPLPASGTDIRSHSLKVGILCSVLDKSGLALLRKKDIKQKDTQLTAASTPLKATENSENS